MTSSSKSSRHWRHVGSKTTPISSTITWMSMPLEQLVSLIRWGHHRPVYRRRNSAPRSHWTVSTIIVEDSESVRRRITTFVAGQGNVLKKALDRSTSRDRARLRLVGPRSLRSRERRCISSCLRCLRGRGRPGGRPCPLESTRTVDSPSSDVVGWTGCVRTGPPRSPLPPAASLATDHSAHSVHGTSASLV